jgi:hypothetical protein
VVPSGAGAGNIWGRVQIQDIVTDGYAVHGEEFISGIGEWVTDGWVEMNGISGDTCPPDVDSSPAKKTLSTGGTAESCWPPHSNYEAPNGGVRTFTGLFVEASDLHAHTAYVRIVKGRGQYPGPHQFVAYGTYTVGSWDL